MDDAVIGSTGFVGRHLLHQHEFVGKFDSRNIGQAAGHAFGTVVCAAAPGSMFEANRFPELDKARIDSLIARLSTIQTQQFVLISTIAVLANSDAHDVETTSLFETQTAYGRNRRALELYCSDHFERCLVVRLPALFGKGLKKNFLFDVLNPMPTMLTDARFSELEHSLTAELSAGLSALYAWNESLNLFVIDREALAKSGRRAAYDAAVSKQGLSALQFTNPNSRFQYYDMSRLWADILLCRSCELNIIHLAPEPLVAGEIFTSLTGGVLAQNAARLHFEDMWTSHSALFGLEGHYTIGNAEIMRQLQKFFIELRTDA